MSKAKVKVEGVDIGVNTDANGKVWFSLTDIAKSKSDDPSDVIRNWMRTKPTIKFLGLWESLNGNDNFNTVEFDGFRNEAGSNAFTMSVKKWIEGVRAIGIVSKSGRYGGTWARRQIALEFASWIDPAFKLYLITEFERLKGEEVKELNWELKRQIASDGFQVHTDAVRRLNVPLSQVNTKREGIWQASEADLLNLVVFGITAKEWRTANPTKKGNIRDHATKEQLFVLNNAQAMNVVLMEDKVDQETRYRKLKRVCDYQLKLVARKGFKILPERRKS
ncbi:MAG: KilA-N domain-containing protein [Bacteroidota bacterium]